MHQYANFLVCFIIPYILVVFQKLNSHRFSCQSNTNIDEMFLIWATPVIFPKKRVKISLVFVENHMSSWTGFFHINKEPEDTFD